MVKKMFQLFWGLVRQSIAAVFGGVWTGFAALVKPWLRQLGIEGAKRALLVIVPAMVTVVCVGSWLVGAWRNNPDRITAQMHGSIARGLAQVTKQALEGKGRVLVLRFKNPSGLGNVDDPLTVVFKRQLVRGSDIAIVATEGIDLSDYGWVSADIMAPLLQQYPDVDAIVSLVGVPLLPSPGTDSPPSKRPKIIVFTLHAEGLRSFVEDHTVQLAVAPNSERAAGRVDPEDLFESKFEVLGGDVAGSAPH